MQVWWKTADSGDASFFSQFTEVPRIAGCCVFVNLAWLSTGAGLLVFSVLGHLCLRKAILDMDGPHCAFKKNCTRLHAIIYFNRALEYTVWLQAASMSLPNSQMAVVPLVTT